MRRQVMKYTAAAVFLLLQAVAVAQKPATPSPISRALEDEVQRAMDIFKQKGSPGPYFIGYEVNDVQNVDVEASLGATKNSNAQHSRFLDIDVRVGDYQYDSTHQIRGQRGGFGGGGGGNGNFNYPVSMPLDD